MKKIKKISALILSVLMLMSVVAVGVTAAETDNAYLISKLDISEKTLNTALPGGDMQTLPAPGIVRYGVSNGGSEYNGVVPVTDSNGDKVLRMYGNLGRTVKFGSFSNMPLSKKYLVLQGEFGVYTFGNANITDSQPLANIMSWGAFSGKSQSLLILDQDKKYKAIDADGNKITLTDVISQTRGSGYNKITMIFDREADTYTVCIDDKIAATDIKYNFTEFDDSAFYSSSAYLFWLENMYVKSFVSYECDKPAIAENAEYASLTGCITEPAVSSSYPFTVAADDVFTEAKKNSYVYAKLDVSNIADETVLTSGDSYTLPAPGIVRWGVNNGSASDGVIVKTDSEGDKCIQMVGSNVGRRVRFGTFGLDLPITKRYFTIEGKFGLVANNGTVPEGSLLADLMSWTYSNQTGTKIIYVDHDSIIYALDNNGKAVSTGKKFPAAGTYVKISAMFDRDNNTYDVYVDGEIAARKIPYTFDDSKTYRSEVYRYYMNTMNIKDFIMYESDKAALAEKSEYAKYSGCITETGVPSDNGFIIAGEEPVFESFDITAKTVTSNLIAKSDFSLAELDENGRHMVAPATESYPGLVQYYTNQGTEEDSVWITEDVDGEKAALNMGTDKGKNLRYGPYNPITLSKNYLVAEISVYSPWLEDNACPEDYVNANIMSYNSWDGAKDLNHTLIFADRDLSLKAFAYEVNEQGEQVSYKVDLCKNLLQGKYTRISYIVDRAGRTYDVYLDGALAKENIPLNILNQPFKYFASSRIFTFWTELVSKNFTVYETDVPYLANSDDYNAVDGCIKDSNVVDAFTSSVNTVSAMTEKTVSDTTKLICAYYNADDELENISVFSGANDNDVYGLYTKTATLSSATDGGKVVAYMWDMSNLSPVFVNAVK
ncbi:MAG: hypothetical protein IJC74_04955 [Clostridia bacterium]|nr:hypothetical protein [Clostridia bacterium]